MRERVKSHTNTYHKEAQIFGYSYSLGNHITSFLTRFSLQVGIPPSLHEVEEDEDQYLPKSLL